MTPTPMTRAQLCGRITALRSALDTLAAQADRDGHGAIPGTGALKVQLIAYENDLRARDRAEAFERRLAADCEASQRRMDAILQGAAS